MRKNGLLKKAIAGGHKLLEVGSPDWKVST